MNCYFIAARSLNWKILLKIAKAEKINIPEKINSKITIKLFSALPTPKKKKIVLINIEYYFITASSLKDNKYIKKHCLGL